MTVADTAARIEHAVIISLSERETLMEIDFMAWNVGRLLLSPSLCFPPQHRVLNASTFLATQVKYLHLCVDVKFSWERVKKEQWHGPEGKTARLTQAFRAGKMGAEECDTLFVVLFNGTQPQKDITNSREYRALSKLYLMMWYDH